MIRKLTLASILAVLLSACAANQPTEGTRLPAHESFSQPVTELEIPLIKPGLVDELYLSTGDVVPAVTKNEELPIIYYFGTLYHEGKQIILKRIRTNGAVEIPYVVENSGGLVETLVGKRVLYVGVHEDPGFGETKRVVISKIKDISGSFSIPSFWCSGVAQWGPDDGFKTFRSHSMFLLLENIYDEKTKESYSMVTYWQFNHGDGEEGIERYSDKYLQFPPMKKRLPRFSFVDTDGELATIGPAPEGGQMRRTSGSWQLKFGDYAFHRGSPGMTCIAAGGRVPQLPE